jgi:hypothetical protein
MRELVRGKNTIGPEVIDPGGRSVEKLRDVTFFSIKLINLSYLGMILKISSW